MNVFLPPWKKFLYENSSDTKKVAKAVMIDAEGKILLLKRKRDQKFADNWDLPGGHIKAGESAEEGLRREVEEETNLSLTSEQLIKKTGRHSFYKSSSWSGQQFRNDELPEHVKARWFSLEEVKMLGDKLSHRFVSAIKEAV